VSAAGEDGLADLARRILAGQPIDWDAAMREDPSIVAERRRLQALVAPGAESTGTAAAPPHEPPPQPPSPPPRKHRDERFIGDFRLVRTLGEGGMGIVYEAEQQHPRRPVALKVIRGGQHVGPDTLKLFQREAQTLARLRHPGIAALYETGVTDDGLHFFAMELVRGETLLDWLKKRPEVPTPEELRLRLSVFKKICDAVAYAHQRGVIHRDLKPGNVLIPKASAAASFQDPVPDVKVLDFGLARITDSDVQATTYVTEMGKVQGTLPYMSPEQVRGNPDEIDQRTDIYSLGVILYQMVTGRLPYDLSKAQLPDAVRIICEEPPKSISATFSGSRRLDADVVTIAGKALEKEPARRYQSVAALGEDVARYLSDQPILARPPSATYQLRKLVARHKGPLAFAATVFVLVAVLAVTSTVQAVRIAKERDRANQEAETAKQVAGFLEELFKVADPSESRGNTITAREILDRGAERIERELKDQPVARARLLAVIGKTYFGLALFDRAEPLLRTAVETQKHSLGTDSVDYATSLAELAWIEVSRGLPAQARDAANSAVDTLERHVSASDPRLLKALYTKSMILWTLGENENARTLYLELLQRIDGSGAPVPVLEAWTLNDLGGVALTLNDLPAARRYMERALDLRERIYPPEHPERLSGMQALAEVLMRTGDVTRARQLLEQAVPVMEKVWGQDHVNVANALDSRGEVARREGKLAEARASFERALHIYERAGVRGTPAAAVTLLSLARVDEAEGHLSEAERHLLESLAILAAVKGYDTPEQVEPAEELARVLRAQGRETDARSLETRIAEWKSRAAGRGLNRLGVTVPTSRVE
jgi:serine/threonine protein kinase/Tfp pilus assembly protein PilF